MRLKDIGESSGEKLNVLRAKKAEEEL